MNTTPQIAARPPLPPPHENKVLAAAKKVVHAVDEYTSPRETTAGNFEKPSAVIALLSGSADGLLYFGLPGVVVGAGSAMAGYAANRFTNNRAVAALAATAAGAGLCAATLAIASAPVTVPAVVAAGALFGLFEAGRTDKDAERRDASNCVMMLPSVLPGPTRFTVAIGSALSQDLHNPVAKAAVGGISAAALTAAVTVLTGGLALPLVAAAGIGGVLAPVLGHRIWQGARNGMADLAGGVTRLLVKTGVVHKKDPGEEKPHSEKAERLRNAAAAVILTIPTNMLKANGNVVHALIGTALKSGQYAYIMLKGQNTVEHEANPAAAEKSAENPAVQEKSAPVV